MKNKGKKSTKIVLRDRTFNSKREFINSCTKSDCTYYKLRKSGMTDQEFYDLYKKEEIINDVAQEETAAEKEETIEPISNAIAKIENVDIELVEPEQNNFLIDANNLINKIKSIKNIKLINLIDFENVSDDTNLLRQCLNNNTVVNIFFYNATIYSNDYYKITKNSTANNFQVLTTEAAKQLVDHLITFYLAIFITNIPNKKYNIVSKDSGFIGFVHFIEMNNVSTVGTEYISDGRRRFNYSVCTFFANNRNIRSGFEIDQFELNKYINDFFNIAKRNATYENRRDVINILIRYKILKKSYRDNRVRYSFDLNEAKLVALDIQNGIL